MSNRLYPIGIQNFESLRKDGYLYVDKTRLIHRLVTTGRYFFFSRPRRFEKSLLISTLEAYFQGKRELFQGLAMEELEREWVQYPILHIDLNTAKYQSAESLDNILNDTFANWEVLYGTTPTEVTLELRFKGIIRRAYEQTGQRIVILVDEYDKPMLQAIGNDELQARYRGTLKAFIYVMEFKLEGTVEGAVSQIEEKCYARPFEADSRQLFKIGINFSNKTRNIEKWIVQ